MDYQLIALSDDEAKSGLPEESLNRRLRRGLNEHIPIVGLMLRPEQRASMELLDWLEFWTREYREAAQRLIVIPASAQQFEALELSHPEQMLSYFSSIEEWEAAYPEKTARQESVPAAQGVPQAPPLQTQHDTRFMGNSPDTMSPVIETPLSRPLVPVGSTVEISGEYECAGCGTQRTWLKGDSIAACENVECLAPNAGWKLVCDLF